MGNCSGGRVLRMLAELQLIVYTAPTLPELLTSSKHELAVKIGRRTALRIVSGNVMLRDISFDTAQEYLVACVESSKEEIKQYEELAVALREMQKHCSECTGECAQANKADDTSKDVPDVFRDAFTE